MADKSPRDVAVEVMKSVKAEIRAYEEGLVKMRAAEVGALKKSLFGLPQQAESNKQIVAKIHKPARTVFDILGKSEPLDKAQKKFKAGDKVHTTMGVNRTGTIAPHFHWKESNDGTYKEPGKGYHPVKWSDGTKGFHHESHMALGDEAKKSEDEDFGAEGSKVDPNTRANGSKRPDIKCKKCGQTKPWSESGANQCNDCFDKQVAASKESAKKSEDEDFGAEAASKLNTKQLVAAGKEAKKLNAPIKVKKKPASDTILTSKKSEEFIDTKEDADPSKRYVHVGAYDNKAVPKKPYPAPGSGGKLEKDALDAGTKAVKPPKPMALKPAGVPAMTANAAPKPPKAPGAPGMTKGEDDGAKKPGVFAKLHAMKAQSTAAKVGTPATQNLAAAKVLTSRVMAKKPAPSPILGKDEMDAGSAQGQEPMAMSERPKNVFEILKKNEDLEKVAPPGFDEKTMHKLKEKYGTESAFKIAWSAHNKKKTKKSEGSTENCPYCGLMLLVCSC